MQIFFNDTLKELGYVCNSVSCTYSKIASSWCILVDYSETGQSFYIGSQMSNLSEAVDHIIHTLKKRSKHYLDRDGMIKYLQQLGYSIYKEPYLVNALYNETTSSSAKPENVLTKDEFEKAKKVLQDLADSAARFRFYDNIFLRHSFRPVVELKKTAAETYPMYWTTTIPCLSRNWGSCYTPRYEEYGILN